MNIHKDAKLTPFGRESVVLAMLGGHAPETAAPNAGLRPCRSLWDADGDPSFFAVGLKVSASTWAGLSLAIVQISTITVRHRIALT